MQPVFTSATAVTKSDSTVLPRTAGLYIGGGGDVTVQMAGAVQTAAVTQVLFKAVPTGTTLYIAVTKVMSTGTTATNILALR